MADIQYGFGRLIAEDKRDWPVGKLTAMIERGEAMPVAWNFPIPPLNQALTQHCVGFAWAGFKACAQARSPGDITVTDAEGHRIYYECKRLEQNPQGEDGAYLRSGAKIMQAEGVIDDYAWADFYEAEDWTQKYGPVVMGTWWYSSMKRPTPSGVITVSGGIGGGHAWLRHADKQAPADNGGINSWGTWGANGRFYLSDLDLYRLHEERGEAICAVKRVKVEPHWPDLPEMNDDDLLSQHFVFVRGVMKGYPDGLFWPGIPVSVHQVGTVAVRLGIRKTNRWNHADDYTLTAKRGWIHQELPMLRMDDLERPLDDVTRFAFMLMCGRYLRGA